MRFALVRRRVEQYLREHPRLDVRVDRVVSFDVTNRRIDGCCYLFFGADGGVPRLVAKAARTRSGQTVFEAEYDNLQALEARGMNAERSTIPRALSRWRDGDTLITLQSALEGTVLKNVPGSSLFSPSALDGTLDRVLAWWEHFQRCVGTPTATLAADDYLARVLDPVALFLRRFLVDESEATLLRQRFETARRLEGLRLPLMARHGDFCASNMVLQAHGIGVFDWEFPVTPQLPLFDLFFFFASSRFPHSGPSGESSHFESFQATYWGNSYFATATRDRLRRAAKLFGVPGEALGDLFVLSLVTEANMKYEGLLTAHGLQDLPLDAAHAERLARWRQFEDLDSDTPFACIEAGVFENLRVVVERGVPEL